MARSSPPSRVVLTGLASYQMTYRLFTSAERGLATLRIKAFRHVHDLPLLTQNTERRGALVSRVTSDVDQVSQFLVFGGIISMVSVGQIVVATVVMAFYSWQLTIVVWVCFLPLFLSLRFFQRRLSAAYGIVRQQVGVMLSAVSEPVVGAATVRSYAIEAAHPGAHRRRRSTATRQASTKAQGLTAFSFSLGGVSAGLANAGVLIVGVLLGVDGEHHRRQGARVRVPGHAVRRPGADRHPGAHRRPERHRRLAPGDRHPGHARPTSSTPGRRAPGCPHRGR